MDSASTKNEQNKLVMNVIDLFIAEYEKQSNKYEKVVNTLQKTLELILSDAGIMAITTTRIKDVNRLREKLVMRSKDKHYKTIDDIYKDIPDLVGGRIALYFPNDLKRIKTLLERKFIIKSEKSFPEDQQYEYHGYSRRFSGYTATHYRVQFNSEIKGFKPLIEIQVASLLMHAWSEVEHDLAYKALKGNVSYEEYEILDEINGLMIAGEISLQRLQRLTEERLKKIDTFSNHYQLALYLYNSILHNKNNQFGYFGDVETLFTLYEKQNRLSKRKINNDLSHVDYYSDTPLSNQLIDLIVDKNLKDSRLVIENKTKKAINEVEYDDEALGAFMKAWIKLEKEVNSINAKTGYNKRVSPYGHGVFPYERLLHGLLRDEYSLIRRVRNEIIHSVKIPSTDELNKYTCRIKELQAKIKDYKNTL